MTRKELHGSLQVEIPHEFSYTKMWPHAALGASQEMGQRKVGPYPRSGEDPKSRSPNSGLSCSYGVDNGTLRWIYFLDPLRGLGSGVDIGFYGGPY